MFYFIFGAACIIGTLFLFYLSSRLRDAERKLIYLNYQVNLSIYNDKVAGILIAGKALSPEEELSLFKYQEKLNTQASAIGLKKPFERPAGSDA